jgi:hypothetical protein
MCEQFYPNANCQNLGSSNFGAMLAATFVTTGTAARPWGIIGFVTMRRTADSGKGGGLAPRFSRRLNASTEVEMWTCEAAGIRHGRLETLS